ncbi:DEAD/DEAH box helicase [Glycomyces sp. NRRL B-16210]|uniref:DEAD/DEAH box helicase n=1 Tax=Glycomyces sp. NRRL B-16210 TaxID=1463821 RepID=UPI000B15D31D|nr:DEAD/DEAH box helicase [Glycomyces sp. NRRL B-16210]
MLDPIATSAKLDAVYRRYLASLLPVRDPLIRENLLAAIGQTELTKGPLLEATPPYQIGASLRELVATGALDTSVLALDGPELPVDRPLYTHQEAALRKARAGRNLIVSTGTGSGKTESFLVPILADLMERHTAKRLGPGVRAILLYPMNALANDQLKRLRKLLRDTPQITFGRYTGDTAETPGEAAAAFEAVNPGEPSLSNELFSREEMRANPPHLLLTNYAMLEYLLLRPGDVPLFDSGTWKYLVVDEAHVYNGTQAAELSMLLRRLKVRTTPDSPLQCIATSATVGDDEAAVCRFAADLFTAPFEWHETEPDRQDLVKPERAAVPSPAWTAPDTDLATWRAAEGADKLILAAAAAQGLHYSDAAEALVAEQRMADLRTALAAGPASLDDLRRIGSRDTIESLVALGAAVTAGSGAPVLSARFHWFARATEGAFLCLQCSHVMLGRHEECPACQSKVFEFGTCQRCGAVHLTGSIEREGRHRRLSARNRSGRRTWLMLGPVGAVEDEDEEIWGEHPPGFEDRRLCGSCGTLCSAEAAVCEVRGCGGTPRRVSKTAVRDGMPASCGACGHRSGNPVRDFTTARHAPIGVLASALYESLPPGEGAAAELPGEGRKLLAFSDSRQAAAFLATYLERSHDDLLHRNLVYQALEAAGETLTVDDLVVDTARGGARRGVFGRNDGKRTREREAGTWAMAELVAVGDRQSLEGLGLLRVRLDSDPRWSPPTELTASGLNRSQCWDLLSELLRTVRSQGAVTMPEDVDPDAEAFAPLRGPIYIREQGSARGRTKVLSWIPMRGTNRREDYLRRVLRAIDSDADPKALLAACWRWLTAQRDGWLRGSTVRSAGRVFQVDHESLRLDTGSPLHRCTACRRIAPVDVAGVCPALGCDGRLESFTVPPAANETDHYRHLYRSTIPAPMRVREHTAQWTSEKAAEIQQEFIAGETNLLSCSTTFELGVDVGDLEAVMLRNVPPTTANYIQRVGRSGRRSSSAALAVTFAQRAAHDLSRYADPKEMIAGEVPAPRVPVGNTRIERRHLHAIVLAAYFRQRYEPQSGGFFLGEWAPAAGLRDFLDRLPSDVESEIRAVFDAGAADRLGITSGRWKDELADRVDRVRAEVVEDVAQLTLLADGAYAAREGQVGDRYKRTVETVRRRQLIGFLANRNVLPKYGFPVDTVELSTFHARDSGQDLQLDRDLSAAIFEYAPGMEIVAGGRLWRSAGLRILPGRQWVTREYSVCGGCGYFWDALEGVSIEPECPVCGQLGGDRHVYVVPEYGFVSGHKPERPGIVPPRRSWNAQTHVRSLDRGAGTTHVWRDKDGQTVHAWAVPRSQLIVVNEGPGGRRFRVCDRCGAGSSGGTGAGGHEHPVTGQPCRSRTRLAALAHPFETDIADLTFPTRTLPREAWLSAMYALLEGASQALGISRDDIDGTLYAHQGSHPGLVLFDTVPGGAGNALQIAEHLDRVVEAALARVSTCDCGEESSCYSCLRGYRNQRFHEDLSRRAALDVLGGLSLPLSAD